MNRYELIGRLEIMIINIQDRIKAGEGKKELTFTDFHTMRLLAKELKDFEDSIDK